MKLITNNNDIHHPGIMLHAQTLYAYEISGSLNNARKFTTSQIIFIKETL